MSNKSSLSVVVPCFNEQEVIPFFEKEFVEFVQEFQKIHSDTVLEVIVVDNNSTDNSLKMLKLIESRYSFLKVIDCSINGYGAALKAGFSYSKSDYIAMLDLDNTYPMLSLIHMYKLIRENSFDIVYGARIHSGSKIGFVRKIGNILYVNLLKLFMDSNLSDVCSGMRLFKSSIKMDILSLKTNDLSFSIDFTSKMIIKKYKAAELPIAYRDRTGVSKLSVFKDGVLFLYVVIKNAIKDKLQDD